ncbi:MAG: Ig domain-containing protein [Prevotellaceae bacterium]|nr:Ig domain-containing protein [Candidatus Colivivens caballi]
MKQKSTFLKVFMTLLLLMGVSSAWADEATIAFASQTSGTNDSGTEYSTTTFISDGILSKDDAFGTITCSSVVKCYSGKKGYGLKCGASSNNGSFILNFKELPNVSKITLNVASYNSSKPAYITVKSGETTLGSYTTPSSSTNFVNWEITGFSLNSLSTINVLSSKYCYIKSITVTYSPQQIKVESVSLDQESVEVMVGKTVTLGATVSPSNASNQHVTWSSSNETVATVNDGVVKALAEGTTTITATTDDQGKTATCVVTVIPSTLTFANTYISNVTLTTTGGTSASEAIVKIDGVEYDAIKAGTGKAVGACQLTIPNNTKVLHFHAAGWNGETVELSVNGTKFNLVSDAGVSGSGTTFTLNNDAETNDYFTINPNGETTVTFKATSGNRFVLFGVNAEFYKSYELTISDKGWASMYLDYAVKIPEGVSVYYAKKATTSTITLSPVEGNIPANCGVVVKGSGNVTFEETTETVEPIVGNLFLGAVKPVIVAASSTYVLSGESEPDAPVFGTFTGTEIPANKAYLKKPVNGNNTVDFTFDDATAIDEVAAEAKSNSVRVNLAGQIVGRDYKGIVIVNGKKMFNK